MRPIDARAALDTCRRCAAEIRAAAMEHGTGLQDGDRLALFALAVLVERRAEAKLLARGAVEQAIEDMIGMLDALDVPDADCEPWLGAPENHPGGWGFGVRYDPATDQTFWSGGLGGDREEENEHGTELDRGERDDCPRPPKRRQPEPEPTNVLPWPARA